MPSQNVTETQASAVGEDDRAGRVIGFFAKAAQNSSRITAQGVDMLLKVAEDDVVSGSKAKNQLQSLKSKVEFFQTFERTAKAYGVLLNDLPGVEGIEQHENKSKEYVNEFVTALQVDQPTEPHQRQLAKLDLLIRVVNDGDDQQHEQGATASNVTCPISGEVMEDPIRNTVCGHVYDRKSIETYMEARRKARQPLKCPVEGCADQQQPQLLSWEILVPDPAMRRAVDHAYYNEAVRD